VNPDAVIVCEPSPERDGIVPLPISEWQADFWIIAVRQPGDMAPRSSPALSFGRADYTPDPTAFRT
jgi:hypothetical protein